MAVSLTTPLFLTLVFIPLLSAQPCPPGTYQDGPRCTECPPGTFNAFSGALGPDLCRPCPPKTFSTRPGQSSPSVCDPCPTKKTAAPGSSQCIRCRPGFFAASREDGKPFCEECPKGSISADFNSLQCTQCPPGTFAQKSKRTSCRRCPAGKEPTFDQDGCEKCGQRFFNDGTFDECQPCDSFLLGNKGVGAKRCSPCRLGFATSFNPGFFSPCQDRCGRGENSIKPRPLCVKDSTPCPSNHFEDEDGVCRRCTTLERYDEMKKKCFKCPSGTFSTGNLDKNCVSCPVGRVLQKDKCVCPDGFYGGLVGKCKECPPGTRFYRIFTGVGECVPCAPGTVAAKPRSLKCVLCPQDKVQPKSGQASCVSCPSGLLASNLFEGEYPDVARIENPAISIGRSLFDLDFPDKRPYRTACVSPQTNCPPEMERVVNRFGKFACQMKSCPNNTFESFQKPTFSFRRELRFCLNCPPGTFLRGGKCVECGINRVSDGGLVTKCKRCPKNKERRTLPDGTVKCVCETDKFEKALKEKNLLLLDDGRCVSCPAGTTGIAGTAQCVKCPAGTRELFRTCSECFPGSFSDQPGLVDCKKCPPGTMSYGFGETSCVPIGG